MARLLIVGDSHITRVEKLLSTRYVGDHAIFCLARGGLRSDGLEAFLRQHEDVFWRFQPTDVIFHVGVCDMLPKTLEDRPTQLIDVLQNVIEAAESLPELWQVPRVFISSFLPHAIRPKDEVQDSELRQRVKRQTNYNVWVDKWLSKTDGVLEDAYHIIGHGWAWASRRHAKSEFYDLSGSWYGLHLNNDGTERLIQDFLSVF